MDSRCRYWRIDIYLYGNQKVTRAVVKDGVALRSGSCRDLHNPRPEGSECPASGGLICFIPVFKE